MQILLNDIELDAVVDTDIALTKAVNKMQELDNRQGSYSSEIAVGLSANNRLATVHAQNIDTVTVVPYSANKCEINVKGNNVLKGFAELEETSNTYKLRAYAELSSIMDLIGELKLNSLNLDYSSGASINHVYDWSTVISNRNNTYQKGFVYPNIDYGKWILTQSNARWNDLLPSVYCKYLLLRIFHSQGYAVTGEFLTNDLFEREILPCVKIPDTPQFFLDGYQAEAHKNAFSFTPVETVTSFTPVETVTLINADYFTNNLNNQFANSFVNSLQFNQALYGECELTVTVDVVNLIGTSNFFRVIDKTDTNYSLSVGVNTFTHKTTKTSNVLLFAFSIEGFTPSSTMNITSVSIVVNYPTRSLQINDLVNVADCLPDVTQKEFLLTLVNQYNLMITVDSTLRTIDFSYFQSVAANKPKAIDWSDKIEVSELPTIQYKIGDYSQNNELNYDTDEADYELRKTPTYGHGLLFCNNKNLDNRKELFKSKFAPIVRHKSLVANLDCAFIELWKIAETTFRTQGIKQRIAYVILDEDFEIWGTDGEGGGGHATSDRSPSAGVYFEQLEFSRALIPIYYPIVSAMLNDTFFITPKFRLLINDYASMDFTKPIFLNILIKGFGNISGYYYCNQITEFKINRYDSTEVELIKI